MRCLKQLDDRVSVKLLLRVWGPRFEFVVRLILVATFLDDSFRAATHFSEHTKQVGEEGCLKSLAATSPELVGVISTVALGIGLLAQSLGSLCLIAYFQPNGATEALIGWAIAQPVLYAQLANAEFIAESMSIVGGLLILRAHLPDLARRDGRRVPLGGGGLCGWLCTPGDAGCAPEVAIARTQLLGRLLLPTLYLYHAGLILISMFDVDSLSMFVVNGAVLVGLVLSCMLVAAGLKSRTVALSLAIVNLGFICYQHPFFRYVWREGGAWKYDKVALRKSVPHVALPFDVSPHDLKLWQIVDQHRYFFFQGLSTSGALLLLAQFGPGEIAVQEDEQFGPAEIAVEEDEEADEVLLSDMQRGRK